MCGGNPVSFGIDLVVFHGNATHTILMNPSGISLRNMDTGVHNEAATGGTRSSDVGSVFAP